MILSTRWPLWLVGFWEWLPRGDRLSTAATERRHRFLLLLVWAHVPFLFVVGVGAGETVLHAASEAAIIAWVAVVAHLVRSRIAKEVLVTTGLLSSSAILVHLTGGLIESHFHFFVMLPLVALYQDWRPFLLGVGYVVVHHGVMGSLFPLSVYNHPAALANPVLWALIHGLYVLGLVIVLLIFWRFIDMAQREADEAHLGRLAALDHSRRLREEQQVATQVAEAKDRFIASVSHELRTPLTAVVGFAELLRADDPGLSDDDRRMMVESLSGEALDVASMIEDLLVAARADAGALTVTTVGVDLRAQVAQVLEGLETFGAGHVELRSGPTSRRALGDPVRVRQILRNLITNALRYGGPNVEVEVGERDATVVVSVMDDGEPIPAPERERIFEAYERVSSTIPHPSSVGLGLAVARKLARLMAGDLTYRYESGSVFELTLPLQEAQTDNLSGIHPSTFHLPPLGRQSM